MSITASFYTFSKRPNSTAIPTGSPTSYNIVLKEGTSITAPVIGLDIGLTTSPVFYNYCYISSFARYYYVTDWTWQDRLWWASCSVDVLASFRQPIMASECYVARAAGQYDGTISDGAYPTKFITYANVHIQPSQIWETSFTNGFYVVGIMNSDNTAIGAVGYYALTPSNFAILRARLMSTTDWTDIATTNPDLGDGLYKSLFNPYQYIVSVNWFPFAIPNNIGVQISTLPIGWWSVSNITAYIINNYIVDLNPSIAHPMTLSCSDHPQADSRGAYLRAAPYSKYRLFFPPFGEFDLDSNLIANGPWIQSDTTKYTSLFISLNVDLISGTGALEISKNFDGEVVTLLYTQTMVAVPIQLAQVTNDTWGAIKNVATSAANTIGNFASLNIAGAISSAATGILNGIEAQVPHVQSSGSNGSICPYVTMDIKLECIHQICVDDAPEEYGRPLCKTAQLSTLSKNTTNTSGFVMTVKADVKIAGYESEIASINDLLNGGVYLE